MKIGSNMHKPSPVSIGEGGPPVIFTHVGVPAECDDLEKAVALELRKAKLAISAGADVICDVSMNKDIAYVQERLIEALNVPFATVSIYETYVSLAGTDVKPTASYFLDIIEEECKRGVDVLTLHATVFRGDRARIAASKRLIPSTSRGGILMLELLEKYGFENPYYELFDKVLEICKKYGVSISLGPCYRPASVADCKADDLHLLELRRMGKLCKKALGKGVNIMIEGIGHASIDAIPRMVCKSKRLCHGVPYRVMTVSTDVAIGFDHISSAIASANAVYAGADSITCVTRSEHLGIPSAEEVYEGVIAAKIAAYSGYIARTRDFTRDAKMSAARRHEGCVGDLDACLFPAEVIAYREARADAQCTMCGEYCPLRRQRDE